MRSHATAQAALERRIPRRFQYRKRYEVTCDVRGVQVDSIDVLFQYRKRYEVTCDDEMLSRWLV